MFKFIGGNNNQILHYSIILIPIILISLHLQPLLKINNKLFWLFIILI